MTLKTGASFTVIALMLGIAPAMAQTVSPQQTPARSEAPRTPVAGQITAQDGNTVLAKDLIGLTVYAPDKSKIGSISDLILSQDAKSVDGFVIGVGGFLGIGEKSVAVKMDRLQITHASDGTHLAMDVKKEELANAPAFKSKKDQDAEKQAAQRQRDQPTRPVTPRN